MTIRKTNESERVRVKLRGTETFHDVAVRLFKDERLVALLKHLNPKVTQDPPPANTTIVVPGHGEALSYAKQNGFALGYNPAKPSGTKAKRDWKRLKEGAQKKNANIDPSQLVGLFETQNLDADVAARRMVALVPDAPLRQFIAAEKASDFARAVAEEIETLRLRASVKTVVKSLADVLEKTQSPRGRRRLVDAIVDDPSRAEETLKALLVVDALRRDLAVKLTPLGPLLEQARTFAALDPIAREVTLRGHPQHAVLTAFSQAIADNLEPLDGECLAIAGVARQLSALENHLGQIAVTLNKVGPTIERAPRHVVMAVMHGDGSAEVPRPWPVIVKLVTALGDVLATVHAGQREDGIACLMAPATTSRKDVASTKDVTHEGEAVVDVQSPLLSAAELASRAAHNARVADDHDGVPARLSPTVRALFDLYRPSADGAASESQRRQLRKTRFENAILVPKGTAVDVATVSVLVDELLSTGVDADDPKLRRASRRLNPTIRKAARALAEGFDAPTHLLLRTASDLGRALVIAAIVLDAEVGPSLARPSGVQAALKLTKAHAVRTLTLSAQDYVAGD